MLDHVRQLSCRFPRHGGGSVGAQGPKALAESTGGRSAGGRSKRRGGHGAPSQAVDGQWRLVEVNGVAALEEQVECKWKRQTRAGSRDSE